MLAHNVELLSITFFMTCSLFSAAVRRLYRPPHCVSCSDMDFNYPARNVFSLLYSLAILLVPCIVNPDDTEAKMLKQLYFVLFCPPAVTLMICKYFGTVKNWEVWRKPSLALIIPVVAILAVLSATGFVSGNQFSENKLNIIRYSTFATSIVWIVMCVIVNVKLLGWVRRHPDGGDEFSNAADFPCSFALRCTAQSLGAVALTWIFYALGYRAISMVYIFFGIWTALFLVKILYPQRKFIQVVENQVIVSHENKIDCILKENVNCDDSTAQTPIPESINSTLKDGHCDKIIAEVSLYVEGEKAFLNPNLKLSDLAEHCTFGQTYISLALKERYGVFYNYVNKLRLNYFEEYKRLHPTAILDDIAERSGFSSRQSYYNVKKRLGL
ncbi:MAG: hypothetical protein IJ150_09295 [Bacteroidales bacterium]|nr:hypothetical protein [Bacteroidales bacterium]